MYNKHIRILSTYVVPCVLLSSPDNGNMNCLLGDDGVAFSEDTCNFTCNTGYEIVGSNVRTCQINGSWSGIDATCRRGMWL